MSFFFVRTYSPEEDNFDKMFHTGYDSIFVPYLQCSRDHDKTRLVLERLKNDGIIRIKTIDIHEAHDEVINVNMSGFWKNFVRADDLIVAPDSGATRRNPDLKYDILLTKNRDKNGYVSITKCGVDCSYRTCVIIDDILDTGQTAIAASKILYEAGASSVVVCATHAVLSSTNSIEYLQNSKITRIHVTNTVIHKHLSNKFIVEKLDFEKVLLHTEASSLYQ